MRKTSDRLRDNREKERRVRWDERDMNEAMEFHLTTHRHSYSSSHSLSLSHSISSSSLHFNLSLSLLLPSLLVSHSPDVVQLTPISTHEQTGTAILCPHSAGHWVQFYLSLLSRLCPMRPCAACRVWKEIEAIKTNWWERWWERREKMTIKYEREASRL